MFVRRRGVWFGFGAEKMFMFCSAKSRKLVRRRLSSYFIFTYEQWLDITAT